MNHQSYLIDTNILIGLEDYHQVGAEYASFLNLASVHGVAVFIHEAAKEDILRDGDAKRRRVSLSKVEKYRLLKGQRGLTRADLDLAFGPLNKPNDVVDATLLHALESGVVDFLVTQDKGIHQRANRRSPNLARRVLFLGDATELLIQTYEPKTVSVRHVAEVLAHELDHKLQFFDSLREGYGANAFDEWWREKCVKEHRSCWAIFDSDDLAGLIVRKDETFGATDAITPAKKILKICTFKVALDRRGAKLGELLLKQVLWYCQVNKYELTYLTTYPEQSALMELLEYYGFVNAGVNSGGEYVYERHFSSEPLVALNGQGGFELARKNYPRFLMSSETRAFGIPIVESYHDILYPDLRDPRQLDLFSYGSPSNASSRPGNTIRKVYLCRASSNLGDEGSLLFFYKGLSKEQPSQALTAIGILEGVALARSTKELMQLTGGRSVYSEQDLEAWKASDRRPVKVINYLLISYIAPAIGLSELIQMGIVSGHPPQSIYEVKPSSVRRLVDRSNLEFAV